MAIKGTLCAGLRPMEVRKLPLGAKTAIFTPNGGNFDAIGSILGVYMLPAAILTKPTVGLAILPSIRRLM